MISRRDFLKLSGAGVLSLYAASHGKFLRRAFAQIPGGTLEPRDVDKFVTSLLIPPVMPRAGTVMQMGKPIDYYEISMKQFKEQILPADLPTTTVWGYGAVRSASKRGLLVHNAPSLTIEASWNRPVRVKWINDIKDEAGDYLSHLLPVDPTLHWANPPQGSDPAYGTGPRDSRPGFSSTPRPYTGPVPIVTHVHGAVGVGDESDGYAEAWYLPNANNIQAGYATEGTWYDFFKGKAAASYGAAWGPGFAIFQYPNHNRASTIWYHDHALGMTRLNVPEFFGNMIMVNGNTWPFLNVEQRRYRFRFLNGCQSRFLILDFSNIPGVEVWQIGNEGGFLAAPVNLSADHNNRLLMGLAERADLIVDFTHVPTGDHTLANVGPDEPFGGGEPGVDFESSDPDSTGQVMQFRVVPAIAPDPTTPAQFLQLPAITPLPSESITRKLALIEMAGIGSVEGGDEVEGPIEAMLGNVDGDGNPVDKMWANEISENPALGATEVWELYNFTADAHPMHVHEVTFEIVDRQALVTNDDGETVPPARLVGDPRPPEAWENGLKDTVIAYPGEVTRIKAKFNTPGQFVWHCHIVEHEDNEMMRPYRIGPVQPGQPD